MQMEPVESVPLESVPDRAAAPEPEPGPDRDRVALEALEAELAVLEDELARVDAERSGTVAEEQR